jgi:hypothetical protein
MAKLWFMLSKKNQKKLAEFYEQQFGMKLVPPQRGKQTIQCEIKLEGPEEMEKIMREVPNYPIDVQGRER